MSNGNVQQNLSSGKSSNNDYCAFGRDELTDKIQSKET